MLETETKIKADLDNEVGIEVEGKATTKKWFDIAGTNKSYELARKMLIQKQDLRLIVQATGLPMSEVKKLAITL